MMKGFVKKGLVLLALGILIAGCAGSTEESSVNPNNGNGISGVPMSYNPQTGNLDIGNGAGAFQYKTADGHSVEVLNGTTPCVNDADGNGNCWVRLKNLDPKYYMANAFVVFSNCATCTVANHFMDNFDIENVDLSIAPGLPGSFWDAAGNPIVSNGFTVHPPTNMAGVNAGGTTPIKAGNGTYSGIAYVADASINEVPSPPYNPFGAPMIDEAGLWLNVKPAYMIAPKCGVRSELWDFGGADAIVQFPFWAEVKASWFQMNPLGDDFVRGGTDVNADDPRFNFTYYTTVYLTLSDLVTPGTDTAARKFYRPGSIYRSNVLAGYKPTWARPFIGYVNKNLAEINFTGNQKYFAVNVGVEAPDRMEAQSFGLKSSPVYEYYSNPAFTISWDPNILTTPVFAGWGRTRTGGSFFQQLSNSQCVLATNCTLFTKGAGPNPAASTWRALDIHQYDTFVATEPGDRGGYIAIFARNTMKSESGFWSYFNTYESYSWWNPATDVVTKYGDSLAAPRDGTGTNPPLRTIPKTFFFRGFARIRCFNANDSTCIQQDGADPDPEYWLANFVLKVLPGKVGMGSEIKLNTFQTNSGYDYHKSFDGFDTTDPIDPYSSFTNAGPNRLSDQANFVVMNGGTMAIGGSPTSEIPNPLIRHRGAARDTGTFQSWNVSVCIK